MTTIDPANWGSRFAAPRAALQMLRLHAAQFREVFLDKIELLYDHITKNCHHQNSDLRSDAYRALESFLKQTVGTNGTPHFSKWLAGFGLAGLAPLALVCASDFSRVCFLNQMGWCSSALEHTVFRGARGTSSDCE
jgi:hypothetical protein